MRKPWKRMGLSGGVVVGGLLALAGCGGGGPSSVATYEVKGRVLLGNGKPLDAGRVVFVSKDLTTPEASGTIGPGGNFALTTRSAEDGAAPGEYKVRIEPASLVKGPRNRKPPFPVKYIDEDSSQVVVTVKAEPNRLDPITLK